MKLQTVPLDREITVFLVGMQCRSWRSLWKVPFIARQMSKMQAELRADPESGFIWGQNFTSQKPFTTLFLSYWQSSDHLERFVRDKRYSHRQASATYWRKHARDPHLGVWHETYVVSPGKSENLYMGMSPFGLSAFLPTADVTRMSSAYKSRLERK